MRATIDEEGRHVRLPTERRRCVVDRELCKHQLLVPVVLAAVGIRLQRVADNSVGPLHLGVYAEPTMRLEPMLFTKGALVNLAS